MQATLDRQHKKQNRKNRSKRLHLAQRRRTPKHYTQTKIDQFIKERYCDDTGYGNPLTLNHKDGQVRLVFQNPRGVLKHNKANGLRRDGYLDSGALEQLRDSETDIVGLAETNINWANK